jgi:hypothetical protein
VGRRRRANAIGAFGLAGVVLLTTLVLDPSTEQPKLGTARSGLLPSEDGSVVLVSTPEEQVVLGPDGTISTVGTDGTSKVVKPLGDSAAGTFDAMASATLVHLGTGDDGGVSLGTSSVAVNTIGTGLASTDQLGHPLFAGDLAGATGAARSDIAPSSGALAAQVTSPEARTERVGLVDPDAIPLGLTLLGGRASSRTTADAKACAADGLVADASADVAGGRLLPGFGLPLGSDTEDPASTYDVVGVEGAASSASLIELTPAEIVNEEAEHTPAPAVAVTARAKVRVPIFTLFPGSIYKVEVRFLAPIEAMATAGGLPGTARAHVYGMLLDPDRPVLAITAYFGTQYITGRFFQTEDGIRFNLGNGAALELAAADLRAAAGGRSASVSVDLFRLRLPDRLGVPKLSGDPDLLETFTGYDSGLGAFLDQLNAGLATVPLPEVPIAPMLRDLRIGHLEASVNVPPGGARCKVEEVHTWGIQDDDDGHPG